MIRLTCDGCGLISKPNANHAQLCRLWRYGIKNGASHHVDSRAWAKVVDASEDARLLETKLGLG